MSSPDARRRSHLFVPGTSDRLVPKALASSADAVVIDLEDGIDSSRRGEADGVLDASAETIRGRPTHLRVGFDGDRYRVADLRLAARLELEAVRLPKAETRAAVVEVSEVLDSLGSKAVIHLTVESALGLARLVHLVGSSNRVTRVVFGERDFLADMGVGEPGPLTDHARAVVAVVSRSAGIGSPIDGAFVDLDDEAGFRASCERAKQLGFGGRSALHPKQLDTIHAVFGPGVGEVDDARAVIDAYEEARRRGDATTVLDGRFVDEAVARQARGILERAKGGS